MSTVFFDHGCLDESAGLDSVAHCRERPDADALLVLVVDDVADNRSLYEVGLRRAGYSVDLAADGEAALTRIASRRPAVIVMDLDMAGMDGWEATRRIKSNPTTQDVLVLVVTGSSDEGIARARSVGADDVCQKPCTPNALIGHLRRLLRSTEARSDAATRARR